MSAVPGSASGSERTVRRDAATIARAAAASVLVLLVVLLYGGYALGWQWTGFGDNDHLWDYLQLLVLPVVLATVPIWLRTHRDAMTRWRFLLAFAAVAFGVLLVGGYRLGWTWTGFGPKTLWDWLDLLVLPVTVALMPLWLETQARLESRWIAALSILLAVFVVLVIGGYGLGWTWTGFQGNTFWDWLHLLLVPFALPAALTWYQISSRRSREREPAARTGSIVR